MGDENKDILPAGINESELEARVEAALAAKKAKLDKKRRRSLIGTAVTIAVELIVALVLIVMVATTASGERFWYFGHFSFSIVVTDSMEPEINVGDFVVIKKCGIEDIGIGDNVVFIAGDGFAFSVRGQSIVHKAIDIHEENGVKAVETKGVNNLIADEDYVTAENIIGKCVIASGALGAVYGFLSDIINWVFVLVLGVLIWFAWSRISRLLKKMKEEKTAQNSPPDSPDGNKTE